MADPPWPGSPEAILALSPAEADRLLDALDRTIPRSPGFLELPTGGAAELLVFGDTHGDWRSSAEVVRRFDERAGSLLVGLGDYIDRTPRDCPHGSVANALYLLTSCARSPGRVCLIQGNHELTRQIPVAPHDTRAEVESLWGGDGDRYNRLLDLLTRGPVAAVTANGVYLAHAGFPRPPLPSPWSRALLPPDETRLLEVTWSECGASHIRRGAALSWGPAELDEFLRASGCTIVLRGHDPDIAGRAVYGGRALTLHTTRIFKGFGGVTMARVPLDRPVRSAVDISIERLE